MTRNMGSHTLLFFLSPGASSSSGFLILLLFLAFLSILPVFYIVSVMLVVAHVFTVRFFFIPMALFLEALIFFLFLLTLVSFVIFVVFPVALPVAPVALHVIVLYVRLPLDSSTEIPGQPPQGFWDLARGHEFPRACVATAPIPFAFMDAVPASPVEDQV